MLVLRYWHSGIPTISTKVRNTEDQLTRLLLSSFLHSCYTPGVLQSLTSTSGRSRRLDVKVARGYHKD